MSFAKKSLLGGFVFALALAAGGRLSSGFWRPRSPETSNPAADSQAFELSLVPTEDRRTAANSPRTELHLRVLRTSSEALPAPRLRVRSPLGWALDRNLPEPMAPGESVEVAFEIEPAPGLSLICAQVIGRMPDEDSTALVHGSDSLCFDPPQTAIAAPPGKETTP